MIRRTYDRALIRYIATLPAVWATIAEDGADPDFWEPDFSDGWFVAEEGEVLGVFHVRALNSVAAEIHPMMRPAHRGPLVYAAGRDMVEWIFQNTRYSKIVCFIPSIFRHVKLYAMRCGFREEGRMRKSYRKGGQLVDQWVMGIEKSEVTK